MERAKDSVIGAGELAALDERLLGAAAGHEAQVAEWLNERQQSLEVFLRSGPTASELDALQARTNRLEAKFLHWRRSAVMELSAIETHLRFLNQQPAGADGGVPAHLDISL